MLLFIQEGLFQLAVVLGTLGLLLAFYAGLRYRVPGVPWIFILMAPLFTESPSYFRPSGQWLVRRAWICLRIALSAWMFSVMLDRKGE